MPVIKLAKKPSQTPAYDSKQELREIKNLLYIELAMILALFAFFIGVLVKYVIK